MGTIHIVAVEVVEPINPQALKKLPAVESILLRDALKKAISDRDEVLLKNLRREYPIEIGLIMELARTKIRPCQNITPWKKQK